ncbi:MAG: ribonuclease R family protein [Alphaproteobacteria bacterium]
MSTKRAAKSPKKPRKNPKKIAGLPTPEQIVEFAANQPDAVGRRELGRAFNITGALRGPFKELLRDLKKQGLLARKTSHGPRGPSAPRAAGAKLPPVGTAVVVASDNDGQLFATPASDQTMRLAVRGIKHSAPPANLGVGDRILARFVEITPATQDSPAFEARVIRKLESETGPMVGVVSAGTQGRLQVTPASRKARGTYEVTARDALDAKPGDLVSFKRADPNGGNNRRDRSGRSDRNSRSDRNNRRDQAHQVCITATHGRADAPGAVSRIAIFEYGLPDAFPEKVLANAQTVEPSAVPARRDLRDIAMITIDPQTAKDHDDAVFAQADPASANQDGWIVIVAIADVASLVRPGSELDREARRRANSIYFPDRVVPMLPERLSADLCSLKPGVDRPVLAVRMVFNAAGKRLSEQFFRATIRSHAKLSYSQAQAAIDGEPDETTAPLLDPVLRPLWGAYGALARARDARQPLDLDLPERRINFDQAGEPCGVAIIPRLTAHRLIEEFMIQANVAAAETLAKKNQPTPLRLHDAPTAEKIDGLVEFLATLGVKFAKAQKMTPAMFNTLLHKAQGTPNAEAVNSAVLRAQSQAQYSPRDLGHFGLNLRRYTHFTSPIRRYADVLVHRALISALGLGPDGADPASDAALSGTCVAISEIERLAMKAERDTTDRLIAQFMSGQINAEFSGRVNGCVKVGLFVTLDDSGADGFVAAASLSREHGEYFSMHEAARAMVGENSGKGFQVGDKVQVRMVGADPLRGGLDLQILTPPREISLHRARRRAKGGRPGPKRGAKSRARRR